MIGDIYRFDRTVVIAKYIIIECEFYCKKNQDLSEMIDDKINYHTGCTVITNGVQYEIPVSPSMEELLVRENKDNFLYIDRIEYKTYAEFLREERNRLIDEILI